MSSSNRGERIEALQKLLKKHYKPIALPSGRTVLENLVYACLLEDAKFEVADELFAKLQQDYFDWNETRVTTITELAEVFSIHPMPVQAALRVKKVLQAIFEARYAYDIEDLLKLNLGKATETVESWLPSSKFVSAYLQQNSFGGHAIGIDNSAMQALVGTGIAQSADVQKGTVSGLERAVPKAKGPELFSLLHQFAVEYVSDKKAPGVQAIVAELGVEPPARSTKAPPPAAKGVKVAEKPIEKPVEKAAEKASATPAKKIEKKEPEKKEPPKSPPVASPKPVAKPVPGKKSPPPLAGRVPKPDSIKADAAKTDSKAKPAPPKAVSKDSGAKSGKGDTRKPTKPVAGKSPPPKGTKKPTTSNKGIAKKKPK